MASWSSEQLFGLESGLRSSVRAVEINDSMPSDAYDFTVRCIGQQLSPAVCSVRVAYAQYWRHEMWPLGPT